MKPTALEPAPGPLADDEAAGAVLVPELPPLAEQAAATRAVRGRNKIASLARRVNMDVLSQVLNR
jgi:hypothetical protein